MISICRRHLAALAAAFAIAAVTLMAPEARAQEKPKIKVSSLTLPVFNPLVWNIMKARGLRREARLRARRRGLSVDLGVLCSFRHRRDRCADRRADHPAEALSGRRAASHHRHRLHARRPGDFHQRPGRSSRSPISRASSSPSTWAARNSRSSSMYAAAKGLDLGKDIIVVNANFAVARAQLEAEPRRRRAGDRAARQHHPQAKSRTGR